ncbi:MAG TPA: alanine racemase [Lachnospiraceae bacterium]|nr:alanine racemase [Lachnospiraceae bacterium]
MEHNQRVCVKVDLDAIAYNLEGMHHKLNPDTKMLAVIKTDGYGHGAIPIAQELEHFDYLFGYAVATAEEAFALRGAQLQKPILVLGYTFEDTYEKMIAQQIRPTVFKLETAAKLSEYAVKLNQKVFIHIKIDTGMSRIGFLPNEEALRTIEAIAKLPMIEIEGIFTHFAKADYADKQFALQQLHLFETFIKQLEERIQFRIPLHHCANSAAIMELPEACMDLVRAGVSMYGLWPSEEMRRDEIKLKPALQWNSCIVWIKEIEAGTAVSYGGTFVASKTMRIATVPVGYGDGYPRTLSNKGSVLIGGKRAPILGRVCMDQMMVDVTDIPEAKEYDKVVLLGSMGEETISAEELGELSGRFNYELVCDISPRDPRIYTKSQT